MGRGKGVKGGGDGPGTRLRRIGTRLRGAGTRLRGVGTRLRGSEPVFGGLEPDFWGRNPSSGGWNPSSGVGTRLRGVGTRLQGPGTRHQGSGTISCPIMPLQCIYIYRRGTPTNLRNTAGTRQRPPYTTMGRKLPRQRSNSMELTYKTLLARNRSACGPMNGVEVGFCI